MLEIILVQCFCPVKFKSLNFLMDSILKPFFKLIVTIHFLRHVCARKKVFECFLYNYSPFLSKIFQFEMGLKR